MSETISETIKTLVEYLVKSIVDKPEEVKIQVTSTTKSILVQIDADPTDFGKIIGRKGRCIDAIKIISIAAKNTKFSGDKKDIFIEIIEEERSNFRSKFNKKDKV